MSAKPDDFARIYEKFQAPISRFDCGRKCAPLNGGEPVCCSTQNAVPLVQKSEWQLLKTRSDLWHRFKPYDATTRNMVRDLHKTCTAIECKGVAHCERDNRSMACRAFPFYPYITREGEFVGLAYYWDFEDSCWVISNLSVIDADFIREFVVAHEMLFAADPEEYDTFKEQSASMRRVFTRRNRYIPLIGREGSFFKVLPRGGKIVPADPAKFRKHGPYKSDRAYARAVKDAQAQSEQSPVVEFKPELSV
jgi:hypothetical protein